MTAAGLAAWTGLLLITLPPAGNAAADNAISQHPLPLSLDFGSGPYAPGAAICRTIFRDRGYGWFSGLVRDGTRSGSSDPWLCDFTEGEDATFAIAVDPPEGIYHLEITLGDAGRLRGPVTITVNGRVVADGVRTAPGEFREVSCDVPESRGRIAIRFQAHDCTGFAVNRMRLAGPPGARTALLFPDEPDYGPIPPPAELPVVDPDGERRLLREMCDFLVTSAPRGGGFSYDGAWYQNAFPIRTLMAGSEIFGDSAYANAALACLDWYVSKQAADANWFSNYFSSPACDSVVPPDSASANLADIGTMTTCLALVAPLVDEPRRTRYLSAAELYARRISLPNQRPDGAFVNRLWNGADLTDAYSIATATQTMSLQALYNATCNRVYLEAAERGAGWLASNTFRKDGRFRLYRHDRDVVDTYESTRFGEIFYVADALILVRQSTTSDSLRQAIDAGMDEWLFGPRGVHAKAEQGYWWQPRDFWSDSKMAGMIYVLAHHPRLASDPEISDWLRHAIGWLADPVRRRVIGVTAPPASLYGYYSMPATGFAGIGIAAAIRKEIFVKDCAGVVRSDGK